MHNSNPCWPTSGMRLFSPTRSRLVFLAWFAHRRLPFTFVYPARGQYMRAMSWVHDRISATTCFTHSPLSGTYWRRRATNRVACDTPQTQIYLQSPVVEHTNQMTCAAAKSIISSCRPRFLRNPSTSAGHGSRHRVRVHAAVGTPACFARGPMHGSTVAVSPGFAHIRDSDPCLRFLVSSICFHVVGCNLGRFLYVSLAFLPVVRRGLIFAGHVRCTAPSHRPHIINRCRPLPGPFGRAIFERAVAFHP